MTRSLWKTPFITEILLKQVFLFKKNKTTCYKPIKFGSRNTIIFPNFVDFIFEIYNGKKFVAILVKKSMVGLKFGSFVNTKTR